MRRFIAIACVAGFFGGFLLAALADDSAEATPKANETSPLAADGELPQLRESLSQIFKFKLESGNLKFDRAAWETAAAEIDKKNAAAKDAEQLPPGMDPESPQGLRLRARLLQERAQLLERQQRMGALPPFMVLFQNFEEQSRHGQRSSGGATGYSSNGKIKTFRRNFEGKTLSGESRSDNDGDWFAVREVESPNRTLELSTESNAGFRIELSDPSGNVILLRQRRDGFAAVGILAGRVQVAEGKSFVDAYRRNRTKMDADLLPVLARFGICPEVSPGEPDGDPHAAAPNVAWGDSPLLGKGELQEYREPLANIIKFNLVDGQLKIDREAWKQTAEGIKKEFADAAENAKAQAELARQNPQAAVQMQQALIVRQLMLRSSLTPLPPVLYVFEKIKEQAQRSSRGFGSGGPAGGGAGDRVRWQSTFTGDVFNGNITTTNDSEAIVFQETLAPRRQLEFRTEGGLAFSLKLTNRDGDLISLRQERGGRFSVVAMLGEYTFADQRDSFTAFVRANRRLVSNELLPALAQFGFAPILAPDSFAVRHAVVASLLSGDEIQMEGKRLVADLNRDDYNTRERASQSLAARYDLYKELVQGAIDDPANSPEVQARLNAVARQPSSGPQPVNIATALELAHDPSYLISLLDEVHVELRPRLIEQLEQLTGQQLGADPSAWKAWDAKQPH